MKPYLERHLERHLERRAFLAGLCGLLPLPALGETGDHRHRAWQPRSYDDGLIPRFSFEVIEMDVRGGLGVFALDTHTGRASGWQSDVRAPLNSTFKFLLAGATLRRVDRGQDTLDRRITVHHHDIVTWSPVLETAVGRRLSIADLCAAMMTRSDNTAANLLLTALGGPGALTSTLRELGDLTTRIDRFEPALNDVPPGDERDTSTPQQMVRNLQTFLLGDALSRTGKSRLLSWMVANTTGSKRIRAGVPPQNWITGDRTGTGPRGETSTIAAIYPPGRKPLLMAVYIQGSERGTDAQAGAHAELARIATTNLLLAPHTPYPDD